MENVLADLALESEAATAFAFRLARGFDESKQSEEAKILTRIATAIGKFWICKRAVVAVGEAMECLGGNGYVEESVLPRLYRDIPVNSIWEGSGNVQCLDVLRSMQKEKESVGVLLDEIKSASGANSNFDFFVRNIEKDLLDADNLEFRARRVIEKLALALQASILIRNAPDFIGEAFCNSRLLESNLSFGTLPIGVDVERIINRAMPTTKDIAH
jgi:putative acyl-CoA dehydrogenase